MIKLPFSKSYSSTYLVLYRLVGQLGFRSYSTVNAQCLGPTLKLLFKFTC